MSQHPQTSDPVAITNVHQALDTLLRESQADVRDMLCKGFSAGLTWARNELAAGKRPNPIAYITERYTLSATEGFPVVPGTEDPMLGFLAGAKYAMRPVQEGADS
jgi:hypothetical protein